VSRPWSTPIAPIHAGKIFPGRPIPFLRRPRWPQQVNTLRATGGALTNEVSTLQWQNGDPAALERDVAARVSATPVSPDAARTAAELDAYAQSLRDRAKAPPPIGRTPAPAPQTAPQ
jgi:hypothetical protein